MAEIIVDTVFRFVTQSAPLVFRFITADYPPLRFRFQTGSEDTVFRFKTDEEPPLKFRFQTGSIDLIFRFKAGESTLFATMEYEVSPTGKTAAIKLTMADILPGENITLFAQYWDDSRPIRVQRAGNNWLIDINLDGAYRIEFYSDQRGLVLLDYIFVHHNSSRKYNAYVLGKCSENEKLTNMKYQILKAIRRSAFSLHKTGQFRESKEMLDRIVNLTCDDRLY